MKALKAYLRKMKPVVLFGLIILFAKANAQDECQIYYQFFGDTTNTVYSNDTTVCYKQKVNLGTEFTMGLNYYWEPGGSTQPGINGVTIKDSIEYILTVFNSDSSFFCKDTLVLNVYPKIEVVFEQISKGCPDECKAQVKATASGGYPPYRYIWSAISPPNDSSIGTGLCTDENARIQVRDTICIFDTTFLVEGYSMPEIEIKMSPDSLYETNPKATFTFENKSSDSITLSNWTWLFPDSSSTNLMDPEYVFVEDDSVHFIYETIDGCIDTIAMPVTVQEFELQLFNVFTPNGDGVNDFYEIPNLDRYITNELVVFNRWGQKVFEAKNYTNNWDGGTLPDGVYYYVLKCRGYWKEDVFKGSVSIYGSSN